MSKREDIVWSFTYPSLIPADICLWIFLKYSEMLEKVLENATKKAPLAVTNKGGQQIVKDQIK